MEHLLSILIIILLIIGITLVLWSLISKDQLKQKKNETMTDSVDMHKSLEEANQAIKDLNELHDYMMTELNKKQKELMLIYDIIDEKERRIKNTQQFIQESTKEEQNTSQELSPTDEEGSTREQVIKMFKQGMDVETIAKCLNIGKGEIQLLIALSQKKAYKS